MTAVPAIPGVVTAEQMRATGAAIVGMQEADGALPWFPGGQTDPWDHIESAMALSVTGFHSEAEAAYEWSRRKQRDDGSWPIRTVVGKVEDAGTDSNFCAYIAVGVWHHYLITGDDAFLQKMWPVVWSAIDCVLRFQREDGAFRWGGDHRTGAMFGEALITGNASIFQALDCAIRIAGEMDQPDADWIAAHSVLGDAIRADVTRDEWQTFTPPSEHSMDWYYPILGGAVRGRDGQELIARRWEQFVVPARAFVASTIVPGSPAPRPVSWHWHSMPSVTPPMPSISSRRSSTCATRTDRIGPDWFSPTANAGPWRRAAGPQRL